jgi:hypothetical protein
MADTKISALTEKTTPVTSDTTVIVDLAVNEDKKTTLNDLPLSTPVTSDLATRMNKTGDSVTGLYSITNENTIPGLNIQNTKDISIASIDLIDDTSAITARIGQAGSANVDYPSLVTGGDNVLINPNGGVVLVTDASAGFNIGELSAIYTSVINGNLTSTTIDAAPLTISAMTLDPTPTGSDSLLIRDVAGASNKKISPSSLPLSTAFTNRMAGTPISLYADYSFVTVTGTTSETTAKSFSIAANTLSPNDLINFKTILLRKTGAAATTNVRIRTNTTNTLVGATTLATFTYTSGGSTSIARRFYINSNLIYGFPFTTTATTEYGTSSAVGSTAFLTTNTNYFFITIQNASTADSVDLLPVEVDRG